MAVEPPEPTDPPDLRLLARRLQERQATTPTTCGYVSGNIASPVTCSAEIFCYSNTVQKVHGCCFELDECFLPTTCLDSTAVVTACNNDCMADQSTLKCTGTANTYCYTQSWNDAFLQYGCATAGFSEAVVNTYTNRVLTTTGSAVASSSTSFQDSLLAGASPTSTSSAASSTPAATGSKVSLSTGAIIGISVGAFMVLFILEEWLRNCYNKGEAHRQQRDQEQQEHALRVFRQDQLEISPEDSVSRIGSSEVGSSRYNRHYDRFESIHGSPRHYAYAHTVLSSAAPTNHPDL